ncbi:MAG: ABC transporter permease [Actinobacteria bacterium]|nr:ABC transporter permease [Actinomycetota bacterium]
MQQFLSFTASGLTSAAIYALVASGLVLTYTTTGIFNFAQGAMAMVGAFTFWQFAEAWGWPAPVALVVCIGVIGPLQGLLVARMFQGLERTSDTVRLVATLGLLLGLIGVVHAIWDPSVRRSLDPFAEGRAVTVLDVRITYHQLLTMAVAVVVAAALWVLLRHTRTGVAMRAAVDNRSLATLNGARPALAGAIAWAIGSTLAVVSGILVAPTIELNALNLALLIVNAYGAAAIGRLRSLPWTFVGALVLGLTRDYAIWLRSDLPASVAPYLGGLSNAVPAIVLLVVLVLLPPAQLRTSTRAVRHEVLPKLTWSGTAITGVAVVVATALVIARLGATALLGAAGIWGIAIIGLSLVPLVGYAGQLSLAQLSFAGVGALAYAHLGWNHPLGLLWAALWGALAAACVALPAARLSGIYLALASGAFALLLEQWIFLLPEISIFGHPFTVFERGTMPVARPELLGWDLTGDRAYALYAAVVFSLCLALVVAVRRGTVGLRFVALKDAPAGLAATGTDAARTKLAAFALSGAIAGVGGAIAGGAATSISADGYGMFAGLPILLLMVVLGIRSPRAAIITGLVLGGSEVAADLPLGPLSSAFESGGVVQAMLIGVAAVAMARIPDGLLPELSNWARGRPWGRSGSARSRSVDVSGAPELVGLRTAATATELAALDHAIGLSSVRSTAGGARARG